MSKKVPKPSKFPQSSTSQEVSTPFQQHFTRSLPVIYPQFLEIEREVIELNKKRPDSLQNGFGFQENWDILVRLPSNAPTSSSSFSAFWIRLQAIGSKNGFRRAGEVWGTLYSDQQGKSVVTKFSKELSSYEFNDNKISLKSNSIQIVASEFLDSLIFSNEAFYGNFTTQSKLLSWKLDFSEKFEKLFVTFSDFFRNTIKNDFAVYKGELASIKVEAKPKNSLIEKIEISKSNEQILPVLLVRSVAYEPLKKYCVAYSDSFIDANTNDPKPCSGIHFLINTYQAPLLKFFSTPLLSKVFLKLENEQIDISTLWESFRTRSDWKLNSLSFVAEKGNLTVRGKITGQPKQFLTTPMEDSNNAYFYISHTYLADIELSIYRNNKLERTIISKSNAFFMQATREKNPYVSPFESENTY